MIPDFIRRIHDTSWRDQQPGEPEPLQTVPELTERAQRIVADLRGISTRLDEDWSR